MDQRKPFIILFILLIVSASLTAEINPVEYARMQKAAPEQLIILPLRVSVRRESLFSSTREITVNARVESVLSSASRLSEGDTITIVYTTFKPGRGWVGPSPIPVLTKGASCPAFLAFDRESVVYVPAARGRSFSFQLPLN